MAIIMFVISAFVVGVLVSACGETTPSATPTPTSAPLSGGQAVFARYCNSCHPGGGRGAGPSILGEDDEGKIRKIVRNGEKRMPGFGPMAISDEQMTELVGYIQTLK
jgi:mono/diheme cytochrome c family protein